MYYNVLGAAAPTRRASTTVEKHYNANTNPNHSTTTYYMGVQSALDTKFGKQALINMVHLVLVV